MGRYDDIKRNTFSFPATPLGTQPPSSDESHPQNTGLADLARGLQYVVNEAAMAAHLHLGKTLDLFFHKDGTPIYREVQLPDGRVMDVPLIALTPPANLLLDTMEVELAVRINSMKPVSDEVKFEPVGLTSEERIGPPGSAGADGPAGVPGALSDLPESFAAPLMEELTSPSKPFERLSFEIAPSPQSADATGRKDNNIMDIKMVFKRDESPEGVARLVSIFTDAMFRAKDPKENSATGSAAAPIKK